MFFEKESKQIQKRTKFIKNQLEIRDSKDYKKINTCIRYKRHLETEKHNYYALICNGVYIRSRATWIEKREKSNSYFLCLEKKDN